MILPNVLLIGVQKSGTTTLYDWLSQHPEIHAPESVKDFHFFSNEEHYIKGLSFYSDFFKYGYSNHKIVLAGGVNHIFFPVSAKRIHSMNPGTKLILVLRNPIDRAFSAYTFNKKLGIEELSFEDAIRNEESRLNDYKSRSDLSYVSHGYYCSQIEEYMKYFNKNQIHILLFEDLMNNRESSYQEICRFLGVSDSFFPSFNKLNETGKAKHPSLNRFLYKKNSIKAAIKNLIPQRARFILKTQIRHWNTKPSEREILRKTDKETLLSKLKPEIIKLESFLNKDLKHWYETE